MKALVNGRFFDGETFHEGQALLIEGARIRGLQPADKPLPQNARQEDLDGALLAPGFIDIQVNGGGGVLFNDQPDGAGLARLLEAHRRHGTTNLLATLISDHRPVMEQALDTIAHEAGRPGLLGIHLEGPYLNPEKAGIHPRDRLRPPEPDAVDLLSRLGGLGVTLVTLAPEQVPVGFIRELTDRGILVAAGHTAAGWERLHEALHEGMSGFTHLFNAMPPLKSREPGPVGVALDHPRAWCSLIVDGHHVHPASLRLAVGCKPAGRAILVSDAMPPAGTGQDSFEFMGQTIRRENGCLVNAEGRLAGADLTLDQAVRQCRDLLGLPLAEALRMASLYPAGVLGLDHRLGRLREGYQADLVLLDPDSLRVKATWVNGEVQWHAEPSA